MEGNCIPRSYLSYNEQKVPSKCKGVIMKVYIKRKKSNGNYINNL